MNLTYEYRARLQLRFIICALTILAISGCSTNQAGLLYSNKKDPVMALDSFPWNSGTACKWQLLGLVTTGDASIRTAMRSGRLGRVAVIDEETTGVLGIYKICTLVYGPYGDLGPPDDVTKGGTSTTRAAEKPDH